MNISGNTIFIPGSTSGIGLALALKLEARGNTVIIGGRRAELLDRIAGEHPGVRAAQGHAQLQRVESCHPHAE